MDMLDCLRPSAVEPPQAIIALLARPGNATSDEVQRGADEEWGLISHTRRRDAGAQEAAIIAGEARAATTVLGPDEVCLESVSMALRTGPVVIQATVEQARRIMERHRRDAFPPE
jgi:hypothetical protein